MDYHLTQIHYDATHLYGDAPPTGNPQDSELKPLTAKFIDLVQSDLFKTFIQEQFSEIGTINLDFRIEKDDIVLIHSRTEHHLKDLQNQASKVGEAARKILDEAKKLWKPSTQTRHTAQSARTLASQVLPASSPRSPALQSCTQDARPAFAVELEALSPQASPRQQRQRAAPPLPFRQVVDHAARADALDRRIKELEAERLELIAEIDAQLTRSDETTYLLAEKDETIAKLKRATQDFDAVLSEEKAQFKALAAAQDEHYTQRVTELRSFHREQSQQLLQQSARELSEIRATYSSSQSACDEKLRAAHAAYRGSLNTLEARYQDELNALGVELAQKTQTLRESERRLGQLEIFSESMCAELLAAQEENTQLRLSLAELEQSHSAEVQALQEQHERDQESLLALTSLLDTHTVEQDRVSAENQEELERLAQTASEQIEILSGCLEESARVIQFLQQDRVEEFTALQSARERTIIEETQAVLQEQQEASSAAQTAALAKLSEAHKAELARLKAEHADQISQLQAASLASSELTASLRSEVTQLQARVEEVTSASSQDQQAYETAIGQLAAQAESLVVAVRQAEESASASGAAANETLSRLQLQIAGLQDQISFLGVDRVSLQSSNRSLNQEIALLTQALESSKRQHEAEKDALCAKMIDLATETTSLMQTERAAHQEQFGAFQKGLAALELTHLEKIYALQFQLEQLFDKKLSSSEAKHQAKLAALSATLDTERKASEATIARLQTRIETLSSTVVQQASQISQLRAQIALARSTVSQKETDKAALSAQVSELQSETIALTSLITRSQDTQSALTQDLLTLHEELAALRVQSATQVEQLQEREVDLSGQLESLSSTLETFKAEHQARQSQLSQEIVALQAQKRSDDTAHADELASLSLTQAAERLSYTAIIDALEESLSEAVSEADSLDTASRDTIAHLEVELATEKLATQTEIAELERQLAESGALLAAQAQRIESLNKEIAALTAAKEESGANERSLNQEVSRLEAARRREVEKQSELHVKNFALQRDLSCVTADYAQYKDEAASKRKKLRSENAQLLSQIEQIRQKAISFRDHCEATLEEKEHQIATLTAQVDEGTAYLLPQLQVLERENQELRATLESTTTHLTAANAALVAAQKYSKQVKVKRFLVSLVHKRRAKKQVLESHIQLLDVLQSQTHFRSPSFAKIRGLISQRGLERKSLDFSDLDVLNKLSLSAIKEFFAHTSKQLEAAQVAHDAEVLGLEERNLELHDQLRELEARNAQLNPAIAQFEAENAALRDELAAIKIKVGPYVQKIMSLERSAEQQAASTRLLQSENSKLQYKLEEAEGLRAAISGYDRLIKAQADRLRGLQETVSSQETTILEIQESKGTLAAEKARIEEKAHIQMENLLREKEHLEAKSEHLLELLANDHNLSHKYRQHIKELEDRLTVISSELERLRRSCTSTLVIPEQRQSHPSTEASDPLETISIIGERVSRLMSALEELDTNHTSLSRRAAQRSERIEALTQELEELKESRDSCATILHGIFTKLGGTSHDLLDREEDESSKAFADRLFDPLIEALKHSADSASESHFDDSRRGSVGSDPALNTSVASSLTGRASVVA